MANNGLTLAAKLGCSLAAISLAPAAASAQCQLCSEELLAAAAKPTTPIIIQIETRIDFSNIGLLRPNQGGTATIDPATGQRTLTGSLISLGGLTVQGTVTVRGAKNAQLSVTLPASVQMFNSSGASYPLTNFTTTLKPNPKFDANGELRFNFGGQLQINGSATGTFRGQVPITVEYK